MVPMDWRKLQAHNNLLYNTECRPDALRTEEKPCKINHGNQTEFIYFHF